MVHTLSMHESMRRAIDELRDAEKRGMAEQAMAALRQTHSQVFTHEAIAKLRETETQGVVQRAMAQMRETDWRKSGLEGSSGGQFQSLMLRTVGQQSAQSAFNQLREEFERTDSLEARQLLSNVAATSLDLSQIFDLPGIVSSNEYVNALANQAGQISAAVSNTDWGQSLAERLSREGLTESFFEDLIDYTKSEVEDEDLANRAFNLGLDTPALADDKALSALQIFPAALLDLAWKSPEVSAATILVFGIHVYAIFSNNPEIDRLKDMSVLVELFAALVFALRIEVANRMNSQYEAGSDES